MSKVKTYRVRVELPDRGDLIVNADVTALVKAHSPEAAINRLSWAISGETVFSMKQPRFRAIHAVEIYTPETAE